MSDAQTLMMSQFDRQPETGTCPGWGEECGNETQSDMDLCPDCHIGRLNAQSSRIPL